MQQRERQIISQKVHAQIIIIPKDHTVLSEASSLTTISTQILSICNWSPKMSHSSLQRFRDPLGERVGENRFKDKSHIKNIFLGWSWSLLCAQVCQNTRESWKSLSDRCYLTRRICYPSEFIQTLQVLQVLRCMRVFSGSQDCYLLSILIIR